MPVSSLTTRHIASAPAVSPRAALLFFAGREEAAKAHGHQFGTVVPKRPFFGLAGVGDRQQLEAEALKWLREVGKKARLSIK